MGIYEMSAFEILVVFFGVWAIGVTTILIGLLTRLLKIPYRTIEGADEIIAEWGAYNCPQQAEGWNRVSQVILPFGALQAPALATSKQSA